jgi:hypothetical protein
VTFTSVPADSTFDESVAHTQDELLAHVKRLGSSVTMDDVMDEAARHGVMAEALQTALRVRVAACAGAAGLDRLLNGIEATERGHQDALASAASPREAFSRAAVYTRGVDELLGRLADGWEQTGCR